MIPSSFLRFAVQKYPFRKGSNRLREYARRQVAGVHLCKDAFGNRMLLDLDNLVDSILYFDGAYERESIELVVKWSKKNGCKTFIDVGANIGCFALGVASDPQIETILAFEPDPHNRAQFMANVWLNHHARRVTIYGQALSSEPGKATLAMPRRAPRRPGDPPNNTMLSSLSAREDLADSVEVELVRFDDLVSPRGEAIAIKVDVEGHEFEVLSGMTKCLAENNCLVIAEIWHHNAEGFRKVDSVMNPLGYHRRTDIPLGDNRVYTREAVGTAI